LTQSLTSSFNNANWGEAVVYFEIFIDTESDKLGRVVLDLGEAYQQLGETDLAANIYNEFLTTAEENSVLAQKVQQRLNELEGNN